jgi:hypothetical protein
VSADACALPPRPDIISGMKSYPTAEEAFVGIGDKTLDAFFLSVNRARRDLRLYRKAFPQWVADHSERGLANWISDRLWAHLTELAEGIPGLMVVEKGPLRECGINNYRFRFKRHDDDGLVASYPTEGFIEFATQPSDQFSGMEETRLIAGYDWNKDFRDIGAAVISLRDGKDNVIWKEPVPEVEDGTGMAPVITPEQAGPRPPTVDVPEAFGQQPEEPTEDK